MDIYVTLNLFFFDRPNIECSGFSFRTEEVAVLPDCTIQRFPVEGLTDVDVGTTSTPVIDFEPNETFFAIIVPFNSAGDAIGCSKTMFSTTLGCGPFMDEATG